MLNFGHMGILKIKPTVLQDSGYFALTPRHIIPNFSHMVILKIKPMVLQDSGDSADVMWAEPMAISPCGTLQNCVSSWKQ